MLQVFPLKKHVEVCHFYQGYLSTVSDNLKQKSRKSHCMIFK